MVTLNSGVSDHMPKFGWGGGFSRSETVALRPLDVQLSDVLSSQCDRKEAVKKNKTLFCTSTNNKSDPDKYFMASAVPHLTFSS